MHFLDTVFNTTILRKILNCLPEKLESLQFVRHKTLTVITKDLFSRFTQLSAVYLVENGVRSIEKNAFDLFAQTLQSLNLAQNLLKTLPEYVLPYEFFTRNQTRKKAVYLYGNPWHCSCELNYLKEILLKFPADFPAVR